MTILRRDWENIEKDLVLVIDCGSTKVAAFVVAPRGVILASASTPNSGSPQPGHPDWIIWDVDELWRKICRVSCQATAGIERKRLRAVIPVTWGTDGTVVTRNGNALYPVISWQCSRTKETAQQILKLKSAWEIYRLTGYPVIPFNTMLRLLWLRKHAPRVLDSGYKWLHMAGLIGLRLTGNFSIEPTLASTGMYLDLARRDLSEDMLSLAGIDSDLFPEWKASWDVIGETLPSASKATGIPAGTPVLAGGHDTQFAAVGAGTGPQEVLLSSGTWEVLMTRAAKFTPRRSAPDSGIMWEIAAEPGFYDPQIIMIASGVLEWVARHFYGKSKDSATPYTRMIKEAESVPPGSLGVTLMPSFVQGSGPFRKLNIGGIILGLSLTTGRGEVYRAALEGLSFQLRLALESLVSATGIEPSAIRVVGGGSKNALWNRIRADATGLPIKTIQQKEATAIGAAMCAFVGTHYFRSIAEARQAIAWKEETVRSTKKGREACEMLYQKHRFLSMGNPKERWCNFPASGYQ